MKEGHTATLSAAHVGVRSMPPLLDRLGPLGLGGAALGNLFQPISDPVAGGTVLAALANGVGAIDTAPFYGFGLSERRIGAVLAAADPDERVIVSTKVGRLLVPAEPASGDTLRDGFASPEPFAAVFNYSYDGVMRSWEESRRRLARDRIDILYVHDIGRMVHGDDAPARFRELMDGGYRALRELRDGGAVGAVGLGVNEWRVCAEAMAAGEWDVMLLAGRYTLLEQEPLDTFLPLCAARGVRVVVGGPFNSGVLATGAHHAAPGHYQYGAAPARVLDRVRAIEAVCDAHGVPLAAAALQFPLAHPVVASVIPGLDSVARVDEAVGLMGQTIPPNLWSDLKTAKLLHPDAPVPAGYTHEKGLE